MTLDGVGQNFMREKRTPGGPTIRRGEEVFEVEIIREMINVVSVAEASIIDSDYSIGYIQITNFSERTYGELVGSPGETGQPRNASSHPRFTQQSRRYIKCGFASCRPFVADAPLVYLRIMNGNRLPL